MKLPVSCTMNPVTAGASAPPIYPPQFWILPNDAVQCRGATTLAKAQHIAPAIPLNSSAVEIAATATNVLGVSAATMVNPAMPVSPITTGILQLLTGETPRRD